MVNVSKHNLFLFVTLTISGSDELEKETLKSHVQIYHNIL